ncbi:hypothetical protein [Bdellovibrio sp. NC01]|uniref:hypothetical protein n=1 Tax=Bdellovibrio sp. NC01 TaxID=2220073 RepID=UPI00115A40C9|nr:hypothetical protein [Bdellovibrio sp. NC01]QDK36167.1 hypothetical protein DOE51_00385 [Bdellovibrio sp. NC01]
MNKFCFSALMFSLLTSAFANAGAKTVLHIPLFVEVTSGAQPNPKYTYVPVAEFNKVLIQKGQKAQPEALEISDASNIDTYAIRDALDTAIQAAGIKNAQAMGEYYPGQWSTKKAYTCYRGDAKGVVELAASLADRVYSDQYTVMAWRLGQDKDLGSAENESDFASKAWDNYNVKSNTVLMLGSVGDDGTDVNESLIPACK